MRVTVRQLKRLIKEAISEVGVRSGGLPKPTPRTLAKIKSMAKRYYAYVASSDPADILETFAENASSLPGGKSLENRFAYVEMAIDVIKNLPNGDGEFAAEDLMAALPEFKKEYAQQLADEEALYA